MEPQLNKSDGMKQSVMFSAVALVSMSSIASTVMASERQDLIREMSILKSDIELLKNNQNGSSVQYHSKKVNVELSGQINRAIQMVDDGHNSYVNNVDNDNSSTRMRVIAETNVSPDLQIGGALEVQLESNSTAKINQLNEETGDGTQTFTDRRAEIYFDHKAYGKLWLGQGWTATDGTSEVDLSGTSVAGGAYSGGAAGVLFRNTSGILESTRLGKLTDNFDGLGRDDRLRYDMPTVAGTTLSASVVQGGAWDLASRYKYKNDGLLLKAALGYADGSSSDKKDWDRQISGSVAVLFNSGWNGLLSYAQQDVKAGASRAMANADPSHLYAKFGYQAQLNDFGITAFSIDYRLSEEQRVADEEVEGYGVQVVQKVNRFNSELYFSLTQYERTAPAATYDDVTVALLGARIKF